MLFSQQRMPDWSEDHPDGEAKCRKFPRPTPDNDPWFDDRDEAAEICNGTRDGDVCPRRTECLHVSMVNYESYGIWGGMKEDDRRMLRVLYPNQPHRWSHESLEDLRGDTE